MIAKDADDGIEVRVTNFGRPIPETALQTIFEPLVRTPRSAPDVHEQSKSSLGLGLFIVREIAAGQGGTVAAQSPHEGPQAGRRA